MQVKLHDRPFATRAPEPGSAHTPRPRPRVSSVVVTLGLVSLLTDIASESVSAILPLYITGVLGLSTVAYGFIDGLMQGATALVRIAGGWASDRTDHPKWVAFAGYALSALTRFGLLVAGGFLVVTSMVALDRVGKGLRTAPRDAMITAQSQPRNLARSFGVHRALDTAGAAIGPLVAFVVLWAIPDGYHTVFVIAAGCAVLGLALLGLMVPDVRPRGAAWLARHQSRTAHNLPKCKGCTCSDLPGGLQAAGRPFSWRFLTERSTRRLLAVAGLLGLLTVGDGFVYLALQDRDGFAATWFPLLYVGTNIAYMSLAVPLGRLADRFGRARVFVWGHVGLLAAYVAAGVTSATGWTTLAALLLLGSFYAATDGVLAALAGRQVDTSVRAAAIGTAQTVVAVARMVASSAFGLLWYGLGRQGAMVTVALVLAAAVPTCWLLLRGLDGRTADTDAVPATVAP